jgi:CBS domain-containing protein
MAGNPEWCLPASRWAQKFEDWIESGDPESLRNAGIFFDLRHVCGDTSLCRQLSDFIAPRASGNVRFQKQLADASLRNRIPIYATAWRGEWLSDLLGNFEKSDSLDLKLQGLMPIVEAARVFALSCGITETGTRRRLRLCMEAGRLPAEEVAAWIDAFDFIQLMRLRIQHSEGREGAVMLEPGHLSLLDKRILKEALRQARKIQQRLELDFPG